MRPTDRLRYWFWCAVGLHGHLPQCRGLHVVASNMRGQGPASKWLCAPRCPAAKRAAKHG